MTIKVSVVMSVFNNFGEVHESINSILQQTMEDFEFLILDDCSSDTRVEKKILSFKDSRIVFYKNSENLGLAKSLNFLIDRCKGEYVARMDADDIAHPERLEEQYKFMQNNPNVSILGSSISYFDLKGSIGQWKVERSDKTIKTELLFGSALPHPTIFFRRSALEYLNLRYDDGIIYAQDYEMWCRSALKNVIFAGQSSQLLSYRVTQVPGLTKSKYQYEIVNKVRKKYLKEYFNVNLSSQQVRSINLSVNVNIVLRLMVYIRIYLFSNQKLDRDYFRKRVFGIVNKHKVFSRVFKLLNKFNSLMNKLFERQDD